MNPSHHTLTTQRLELIAATHAMVLAERDDRMAFGQLLNADVPREWPPPLNDEKSLNWVFRYLEEHPDAGGWSMWYFILRENNRRIVIGNGGFKGAPQSDGTVEVGYSIIEHHQRKGYAPEAIRTLIDWAFHHPEVTRVIAETLPALRQSMRVMEKSGLTFIGRGSEEGVIRYGLTRERFTSLQNP